MRVTGKNILVELEDFTKKDKIWTPSDASPRTGVVREIGQFLVDMRPQSVRVGDKIRFKEFGDAEQFEHEGIKYAVMSYKSILIIY